MMFDIRQVPTLTARVRKYFLQNGIPEGRLDDYESQYRTKHAEFLLENYKADRILDEWTRLRERLERMMGQCDVKRVSHLELTSCKLLDRFGDHLYCRMVIYVPKQQYKLPKRRKRNSCRWTSARMVARKMRTTR